eukprot:gene6607-7674_t
MNKARYRITEKDPTSGSFVDNGIEKWRCISTDLGYADVCGPVIHLGHTTRDSPMGLGWSRSRPNEEKVEYTCVPNCQQVTFASKIVGSWADNNGQNKYIQVEVTVTNHGPRAVKNVIIDTDYTLKLRNPGDIWNVAQAANGDLSFPSYISPLASGNTYTLVSLPRVPNSQECS